MGLFKPQYVNNVGASAQVSGSRPENLEYQICMQHLKRVSSNESCMGVVPYSSLSRSLINNFIRRQGALPLAARPLSIAATSLATLQTDNSQILSAHPLQQRLRRLHSVAALPSQV